MKSVNVILAASLIFLSASVSAQAVSRDSISILKQQKENIVISKRINDNKLKLAKLENTVEKKTMEVQTTGAEAQKSANENGQAADKLTNDAQDKKLASDASKKAKEAKHDAKEARKANANLESLRKDIETLKSKIASDESRLVASSDMNSRSVPDTIPQPIKN
jgi:hypothetical protein